MKALVFLAFVSLATMLPAQTQSAPDQPKSLGEVARDSKKEKKEPAKIVLSDETEQQHKAVIPDVFYGGVDNTDEILKAIDDYHSTHNLQETEAVVHIWFDKHDAMLLNAIEENRRIEQRERDRSLGYTPASDAQPRSTQEYQEMQRVELISRREDLKHKQENGLLSARIQQAFGKVRAQVKTKYGMNVEWFKIRCGNGNCSF
ncbi:MAG TPA: hypothetical protein VKH81_22955 [Candidatus Angelobacter sp.]|nr:hypothetical protein [Candidatus Angelobacter sp.]